MSATSDRVLATICSAIQYLVDRGEIDHIDEVLTSVRYTETVRISHFDVKAGRKYIRVFAKELKSRPERGSKVGAKPAPVMIQQLSDLGRKK